MHHASKAATSSASARLHSSNHVRLDNDHSTE